MRYVAIGDSFSEGVGDDLPDGRQRGWADLVAQGWANATGSRVEYANLAIRGKLIWPIVREQLEPALALRPTHLSFNGGGNDMLRPRADIEHIADAFTRCCSGATSRASRSSSSRARTRRRTCRSADSSSGVAMPSRGRCCAEPRVGTTSSAP